MQTRLKKAVIGGATVAILGIGALTGQGAFAQTTSTPTTTTGTTGTATATVTAEQAADQAEYQAFVAALGTNLGISDPTKVDAAIRATLKQLVDAQFTAGNISANEATAEKAAIDASSGADLLNLGEHGGHDGDHGGGKDQGAHGKDANDGGNGATDNNGEDTNGNAANGAANSANASS